MKFRRGFKTEAECIALELRQELGLRLRDPLDPFELAKHLAIPVIGMTQLEIGTEPTTFVACFSTVEEESFSAVTIFDGRWRMIVHNDHHHPNRRRSNVAHEVSHTILEHEPTPVRRDDGQRFWDPEMEGEATWLGAALLVPRDGALALVRRGFTADVIADHYGVSPALCEWRLQSTGIYTQIARAGL